jgi:prepilin-type N-terminal cleavage/methylation domain-containing protein
MEKTNRKKTGFTLIELLVVIVIIGILSTISTATFKSYFGKARDAERQAAVQNIALMIKVDGADTWDNGKYIYTKADGNASDPEDLLGLFKENDFRIPKGTNNICYVMVMAEKDEHIGDYNEFYVSTWGESTSTRANGTSGPLVDGTESPVADINKFAIGAPGTADALDSGDYACAGAFADVLKAGGIGEAKSTTVGSRVSIFTIDAAGALTGGNS